MAREDRKADLRARIGLEDLEGRALQSALVGGAAAVGTLIPPTAASASAYHTTVWGGSGEGLDALKVDNDFGKVKIDFITINGESATIVDAFGKATPILF
jgi:hypothetical protein